jgi:hypothetical protein
VSVLKQLIKRAIIVDKTEREYIGGHVYMRYQGYKSIQQLAKDNDEHPFSPNRDVTLALRKSPKNPRGKK